MLYVCQGTWAPPEIILHALLKRERRAWSRIAGIQSLTEILSSLTYSTAQCDALMSFGTAFRAMSMTSSDNFICALTEGLSKRMDAISFLEGSSKSTRTKIYHSFQKLYAKMFSVSGIGIPALIPNSKDAQPTATKPKPSNPFLSLVVLWSLGIDWDASTMSLIENSSNILQLLHQKITISNYSSSIHLWQEEQELELRQSRNAIKIPQKLFESKSRGSSEKKRRKSKSVEIPQTTPAYRRN